MFSLRHETLGDQDTAVLAFVYSLEVKLIVAIVPDPANADRAVEALVAAGYPGPTRINTSGGFLRRGNATLLLGTDDERVEGAIDVLRSAVEAQPAPEDPNQKRATIFVLNTSRFIRV